MYAVIMCGGSGTRFWPASRRQRPKQFLDILGSGPMVVETCDRMKGISRDQELILILGREHQAQAMGLLQGRDVHILAEPVGRNTAPCMGLGALYAKHLGCNTPLAFLPADHFIARPERFLDDLKAAENLAREGGIVTLGIVPDRPETGYGYIRRGSEQVESHGSSGFAVRDFVEKPPFEKAVQYLKSGEYYWNAGIFVALPETILSEIQKHLPDLYGGLESLSETWGTEDFEPALEKAYAGIQGVSFDYGIMEKTRVPVQVVPSECGWSDVGSWASLYALRSPTHDTDRNLEEGEVLMEECQGTYVSARGGRLVACLGLRNTLVVDTGDALLVADLERSQDIRRIVDRLKDGGKETLL